LPPSVSLRDVANPSDFGNALARVEERQQKTARPAKKVCIVL
jgi:hypothetical protein